jgi:hypothetical protein
MPLVTIREPLHTNLLTRSKHSWIVLGAALSVQRDIPSKLLNLLYVYFLKCIVIDSSRGFISSRDTAGRAENHHVPVLLFLFIFVNKEQIAV